jgi:F-type H+-transporting ATPase subunit epsilon
MKVSCEILTLGKRIFSGEVDTVSLPTADGWIEVLPRHEPLVANLTDGELKIRQDSQAETFAVSGGFAKITPEKITIMAEMAERTEDISAAEAAAAVAKAAAAMKRGPKAGGAYEQAAIEYRRLLLRLNVARRRKKLRTR